MALPSRRPARVLLSLAALLCLVHGSRASANDPPHRRVVVVILENKSVSQVASQPYIASLIASGATFASSAGVTHPSQPNYFALWAGSVLGVTTNTCPAPGTPFTAENFGHACEVAGIDWGAYCENLPYVGDPGCSYDGNTTSGLYTRKHCPWTNFVNIDHSREKPWSYLAGDIAADTLPELTFLIPNNCHNMHNSTNGGCSVADGDAWLSNNLPPILSAMGKDGVLILTFDEDDNNANNQVLTVFVGPYVMPGYVSPRPITHYTVVRTISDYLGLPVFGQAVNETAIDDIWNQPTAARTTSWGRLKLLYR